MWDVRAAIEASDLTPSQKKKVLNPWWRLTHLYYLRDKKGKRVLFKPWAEQLEFLERMWYLNLILKARQRGMTHAIQIYMLDRAMFNNNQSGGVIAHRKADVEKFFDKKIKYAYDNMHPAFKALNPNISNTKTSLVFRSGSSIYVDTSLRGDTLQMLHVSEYGKMCAQFPDKAQEVREGALNAISPGNFVAIESTAEGAHGDFAEKSNHAMKLHRAGTELSKMDYKFHFFPWYRAPEYTDPTPALFELREIDYFEKLAREHNIHLTEEQKNWYVRKQREMGSELSMRQEFPSFPEEAFSGVRTGSIFGEWMAQARLEERIGHYPHDPSKPVHTFWDIGKNMTSVWFHQRIGAENRFINFFQQSGIGVADAAHTLLQDKEHPFHKYTYGMHYFPHDMNNSEWGQAQRHVVGDAKKRIEVAMELGLKPAVTVERIARKTDAIDMGRQVLPTCTFDAQNCKEGIDGLEKYHYKWDDAKETYSKEPVENLAAQASDAFMQMAQGFRNYRGASQVVQPGQELSRSNRGKRRAEQSNWRT